MYSEQVAISAYDKKEYSIRRWFQSFDWDGLSQQTLLPPLIQMVSSPVDTRNFDYFPFDDDIPPDELSGWDAVG